MRDYLGGLLKGLGTGLVCFLLVSMQGACIDFPSSTTVISNTATNNQPTGSQNPTASPSPVTGIIEEVKVTQFGEGCPSGVEPSGDARMVRVGCTKFLTCTPFMPGHVMAPPEVHGPSPTFFDVVTGRDFVSVDIPEEDFNRDVKGLVPGVASFECEVKGVRSAAFNLTVIR